MHQEPKGTGVMHLAVIGQPSLHVAISQLSHHAATPHVVTAPSAAIANVLSLLVETSPLLHRVATSHLVASAHHAATILTPAHVQIVRRLTVLPTQVSQHVRRVTSRHVPQHQVARPLRRAVTAQLGLAPRVQVHHVPQPVLAAALTLTAVAVKAAR
jgi:hypothetical protein